MNKPSFLARHATRILLVAAIVTPFACFGAIKAIKGNRNDVSDWLPKSYPETVELRWFRKHFVADQFVIISWDGATLGAAEDGSQDDPRLAKLTQALLAAKLPANSEHPHEPVFKQVTSARDVLRELTSPPTNLSRKQATERLAGSLIGPDGKQTALMATLTEAAAANLRESVGRPIKKLIRTTPVTPLYQAVRSVGLTDAEVRLGGPPIDNVAIDEEGERTLIRLAGLAGLLGISLAYLSLRSIRMTAIVFACGILSAAVSLAAVPLLGSRMDAILMSMPALIYVLAVSGAVHLINYYRQAAADEGSLDHAMEHAVVHAWRPAILTSVTTAIGLASLLTSDIVPIAKFGGFSALGTMTMLAVLFLVLPAALKRWPWLPPELASKGHKHAMRAKEEGLDRGARGWNAFGGAIRRHHAAVLTCCMLVIVGLCFGLPRTTTSIDLLKLFSEDAQLLKDYEWFEAKLGKIVPMELVVRFPTEVQREQAPPGTPVGELVERYTFYERLKLVERIQQNIDRELGAEGLDLVGATMSAATFAPSLGGGNASATAYNVGERAAQRLLAARPEFERSGYLRLEGADAGPNAGEELWRISVRLAAFHGMDHGELVSRIRAAVEPVVASQQAAADALVSLAQRRHGRPQGAHIKILAPAENDPIAQDIRGLIATKNVRADIEAPKLASLSDDELRSMFARTEGVVIADGFERADYEQIRRAQIPVLATQEAAREETRDNSRVGDPITGIDVTYTGVVPVVYKAQHALLESLVQSTWWSFATILPLMMWVTRGFWSGIVVMVPNTLPVLVVFGGMGWLGIPVDIGSMMAASIALGVAVDDTIHFLAWYKDDLKALGDRHEAVLCSYRRSASATLQAGLINGLGLSVFATSSFTPTQRFGWLMLTILVAGITAELVMLPSLMFGPIGTVFSLKSKKERQAPARVRSRDDSLLSPLDRRRALREHGATVEA